MCLLLLDHLQDGRRVGPRRSSVRVESGGESGAVDLWPLTQQHGGAVPAVRLADRLVRRSTRRLRSAMVRPLCQSQQAGEPVCSLGEVRNRADLVIFWRNPAESHPRHFARYSLDASGLFVPGGRADRELMVVDTGRPRPVSARDTFVKVPVDADFDVIWALRLLLCGIPLPASFDCGVSHAQLKQLASRLLSCRYGAVFFGLGLARRGIGHVNVEALLRLVRDLNAYTRFTARRVRFPETSPVPTPSCVGKPASRRRQPGSRSPALQSRRVYGERIARARWKWMACSLVGSEAVPEALAHGAAGTRSDTDHRTQPPQPAAWPRRDGSIHDGHLRHPSPGTAYRMDEVPIPLRQLLPARHPLDDQVLNAILQRLGR